jgi:hypothetical protein
VSGEIVEQGRGAKILVFHYKRKKQYKKLRGHRQNFTAVRITEIAFDGQSFKAPELPKKEPKAKKAEVHAVEAAEPKAAKKKAPAKKSESKREPLRSGKSKLPGLRPGRTGAGARPHVVSGNGHRYGT